MNEIFNEKLQRLNEDTLLFQAIKNVIFERIEKEKPLIEPLDTNEIIGQKYRAYCQAKNLFEEILLDIVAHGNQKVDSDKFNKGK